MKHFKLILVPVLVVALAATSTATALAHGSDDTAKPVAAMTSDDQTQSNTDTEQTETRPSRNSTREELRQQASDDLSKLREARREDHKNVSDDAKKKVCESHKKGLETKFASIARNSQRIQDRITEVLDKAVAYKTDNNLSPENWDTLVAAANTAKDASATSITALKEVTPMVDCNNTSVASDVATFKAAAAETRDNLKAYRTTVKAVLKALLDAKQTTTTNEGSDQ